MYIEYTPIDLFDEADQHLQYPAAAATAAAAATTTIGFGVGVGGFGGGGCDEDYDDNVDGDYHDHYGNSKSNGNGGGGSRENQREPDEEELSIVQNGNGFFELKSRSRPTKRKCSLQVQLPAARIKKLKSIKRSNVGVSSKNSSIPMGLDILARLRKLFSDSSDGGFGRKRRADGDWNRNNNSSSQFKYRRVDNEFPKFVQKSFEEDEINIVPQRLHKSPLVMAQQNQKEKKSQFVRPKTVTKHITNTNFADIEFSDDDDAEFVFTNSRGEAFNLVHQSSHSRPALPRANVVMPSSSSSSSVKMTNIPFKQRQPPPPLIQARTGNILASTLMPELQPIRQHAYSSILAACANGLENIGPKGTTSKERVIPIQRTTSPFLFNGNAAAAAMSYSSFKGARSIIAQENQSKDQEQYRELLQKLIPNLYGIKGTSPKESIPTTKARLSMHHRGAKQPTTTVDLTNTSSRSHKLSGGENLLAVDLSEDEDDDVTELIDLADDELNMLSACSKLETDQAECLYDVKKRAAEKKQQLPFVEPVNSLKEKFDLSPICQNDWLKNFNTKWEKKRLEQKQEIAETEKEVEELSAETRHKEKEMQERLKELQIVDPTLVVIDDFPEDEEEPEFPELTPDHNAIIKGALFGGPADQMLITKFSMTITRRDIATLLGKSWLNDEVINFYMNLLTERGELRQEEGLPRVYAMNTFFVPRLMQSGHSGVRRWTRKVDIFTYDVLPVPVHVGGVHWCMAIVHLRERSIKYYDSMGTPNPKILQALEQYLREESLDKRKRPFDTADFVIESVRDVPRQMNGSDCGVFSCMFAEYITRNREITFSQQHMDYFRHKMILEIVQGQLMQ